MRVQFVEVAVGDVSRAYTVKDVDEALVRLAVDALELDAVVVGVAQGFAVEEVHRVIVRLQNLQLVVRRDRRKLLQVSYHEKLHASERLAVAADPL